MNILFQLSSRGIPCLCQPFGQMLTQLRFMINPEYLFCHCLGRHGTNQTCFSVCHGIPGRGIVGYNQRLMEQLCLVQYNGLALKKGGLDKYIASGHVGVRVVSGPHQKHLLPQPK